MLNLPRTCWRGAAALGFALLASANPALAQPARIGATSFPKPADGGTREFSAVAYDASSDTYLVAWAIGQIGARFVGADGTLLGSPVQLNTLFGDNVRIACGGGQCLVAWVEEPTRVVGRFVTNSGGAVTPATAAFFVSANGKAKLTSAAPGVAYSPVAGEFLVAWTEFSGTPGGPDIRAQRVSPAGALVGGEIAIAATGNWEGMPTMTYNSQQDEYVVGYYFELTSNGADSLAAQRVKPGTGALVGGRATLYSDFSDLYPEIQYNSRDNTFLGISWGATNPWMLHGWLADGNLQALTAAPGLALASQGGGNGLGLAYNASSSTFLAVFQSQKNAEVWGVEISRTGAPGAQAQLTVSGTTLATQPAVAASSAASRWLSDGSEGYKRIMAQLVGSGPMGSGTTGGCTTASPGTGWTCVNGTWVAPTTTGSCTTVQPGANWTCVNGSWFPPTTTTGSCTTVSPGTGWTCVNGNWLPPTTTSSCTTVQPGANWTCVNGSWYPPTTTTCTTASPGTGWTCVNGTWVAPTTSSCTTVQPGANWTCVNGSWFPPTTGGGTTSSCTTVQPGANWTCVNGSWFPPTTTTTTSTCTTVQPGPTWTCVNGNWLPPS